MRGSVAPPWKMPPDRGTAARSAEEIGCRFRVRRTTEADTSITHTLSTTLIGPDGKVVRFYPGNDWTADQLTADVRQRLGA